MVTVQWLDRSRSDGPVGVCTRVFAKLQIARYIAAHVADLPQHSKARAELLRVLDMYRSYEAFRTTFASVPTPDLIYAVCVAQDIFDRMQESFSQVANTLNKLLFEVFACSGEHEDNISTLCKNHAGPVAMLDFDNWASTTGSSMAEVTLLLGMNKLVVHAIAAKTPPPASALWRKIWQGVSLAKYEMKKNKDRLRLKYLNVGTFKCSTVQGMTECPDVFLDVLDLYLVVEMEGLHDHPD